MEKKIHYIQSLIQFVLWVDRLGGLEEGDDFKLGGKGPHFFRLLSSLRNENALCMRPHEREVCRTGGRGWG